MFEILEPRLPLAASIAGHFVFYNDSVYDGNDLAANAADDGAIAIDKQAILPLEVAIYAHVTSYARGINGVMIDIHNLANPGLLSLADFQYRAGRSSGNSRS